ncbi:DCN1-like protein 4 isoform X2 [Paramacrobiotus metropolitanus]|uniref:DCN1-like protein 4 isoform X2 n=1 Tax=Paramacrobiotus metropolitanus TaxID=2943436 RepID=UPI0024456264|nr:DCN1-like protein 4 isoform X2 [Paramacrobiotus metropolitanus]
MPNKKGTKRVAAQPKAPRTKLAKTSLGNDVSAAGDRETIQREKIDKKTCENDTSPFSEARCIEWFRHYAEKSKSKKGASAISRNGLAKFCAAVDMDPNDVAAIVLSKKLDLKSEEDTVSQSSWVAVMAKLECDSNEKFKKKMPEMLLEIKKRPELVALCEYAFGLAKQPGEKAVATEVAAELFSVMLKSSWALFPDFAEFFQSSGTKGVSLVSRRMIPVWRGHPWLMNLWKP